ncbi:Lrp/AsnC family transcriptional regulator [Candidatus Woesearchaeota archaeon]|nr:Lrp/AsnC family transcriptional regulator [Candidatus Woesearchaeota archaeon]
MKNSQILSCLRNNARMSLMQISKKTGIPISTIHDRIKGEEGNAILRYTSLLDFSKLGYSNRATILLKVDRKDREELSLFLFQHPLINSAYKVSNGFDFIAEGIFQNVKSLHEFIDKVEERFTMQDIKTHFVLEDLKRECFLSDDEDSTVKN